MKREVLSPRYTTRYSDLLGSGDFPNFQGRYVPEADLRYYSEEEAQEYLGLLGNNYDI